MRILAAGAASLRQPHHHHRRPLATPAHPVNDHEPAGPHFGRNGPRSDKFKEVRHHTLGTNADPMQGSADLDGKPSTTICINMNESIGEHICRNIYINETEENTY